MPMKAKSKMRMKISSANALFTRSGKTSSDDGEREKRERNAASPLHRARPPASPLGRIASVRSSMRKTTMSPESAPMN